MNRTINLINTSAEEIATLALQGRYQEATDRYKSEYQDCDKDLARMTKLLSLAAVKKKSVSRYVDFKKVFESSINFLQESNLQAS